MRLAYGGHRRGDTGKNASPFIGGRDLVSAGYWAERIDYPGRLQFSTLFSSSPLVRVPPFYNIAGMTVHLIKLAVGAESVSHMSERQAHRVAETAAAGDAAVLRHLTRSRPRRSDEVLDPWRDAVRADGRDPDDYRVGIIRSVYVTDDRDRDWPIIREAERFRMGVYSTFMAETPDDYGWGSDDGIPQNVIIGTAEEVVQQLREFIELYGITDLATSGLPPGIDPEFMAANLERLAADVIPHLK